MEVLFSACPDMVSPTDRNPENVRKRALEIIATHKEHSLEKLCVPAAKNSFVDWLLGKESLAANPDKRSRPDILVVSEGNSAVVRLMLSKADLKKQGIVDYRELFLFAQESGMKCSHSKSGKRLQFSMRGDMANVDSMKCALMDLYGSLPGNQKKVS